VRGDIDAVDDVAADVVAVSHVNDCDFGWIFADDRGQGFAGDPREVDDGDAGHCVFLDGGVGGGVAMVGLFLRCLFCRVVV
jgi:hypothetical protein